MGPIPLCPALAWEADDVLVRQDVTPVGAKSLGRAFAFVKAATNNSAAP
jgi:hypothetical protein